MKALAQRANALKIKKIREKKKKKLFEQGVMDKNCFIVHSCPNGLLGQLFLMGLNCFGAKQSFLTTFTNKKY